MGRDEWPRCSSKILVVSPKYGDSDFRCDVIVGAIDLAPWAKRHAEGVFGGGEEQVARLRLPVWLSNADLGNNTVTTISEPCKRVLKPYVLDFISDGIAELHCPECNSVEKNPQLLEYEVMNRLNEDNWINEWRCSKGHLLHYLESYMRFI